MFSCIVFPLQFLDMFVFMLSFDKEEESVEDAYSSTYISPCMSLVFHVLCFMLFAMQVFVTLLLSLLENAHEGLFF